MYQSSVFLLLFECLKNFIADIALPSRIFAAGNAAHNSQEGYSKSPHANFTHLFLILVEPAETKIILFFYADQSLCLEKSTDAKNVAWYLTQQNLGQSTFRV
jgi:hypothetical protein